MKHGFENRNGIPATRSIMYGRKPDYTQDYSVNKQIDKCKKQRKHFTTKAQNELIN